MKVIRKQTEEKLIQKLRTGQGLRNNKHALHIKGSMFKPHEMQTLPERLTSWIGHDGGEIYVCHDHDIFVFSDRLSSKVFQQFKKHFMSYFQYPLSAYDKILSFYDLKNNTLGLTELAAAKLQQKIQAERQAAAKQKAKTLANKKASFMDMPLSTELIATLGKRRYTRSALKILVVEDDPFSRKLIHAVLNGHKVHYAGDGTKAIQTYLQEAPDMVFLDINLPDVSGHDVLRKLLSVDPDTYVVMLSGNSQSENVLTAMKIGAKGFIGKPFTKDKLLQYITKCSRERTEQRGAQSWM